MYYLLVISKIYKRKREKKIISFIFINIDGDFMLKAKRSLSKLGILRKDNHSHENHNDHTTENDEEEAQH
jgi:hypothetical protein